MAEDIEEILTAEDGRIHRSRASERMGLRLQLLHRRCARARRGLVSRDHHALDADRTVQRRYRNQRDDGRAVRIGDNRRSAQRFERVRIHFRHNERTSWIGAECAGIVDDQRACVTKLRTPLR